MPILGRYGDMQSLLSKLSAPEVAIVRNSLRAAIEGPFFPDWEFETLIGVDRATVRSVYNAWPSQTVSRDEFSCAVVGSMNNLLAYPHGFDIEIETYVPGGKPAIKATLDQLIALGL